MSEPGFWRKFKQEAEPIIAHAMTILVLEASLLLIGLATLGLERLFPKQEPYFSLLEKVEIWMALALLVMFGLYTLTLVGIRLIKGLQAEFRGKGGDNDRMAP